VYCLGLRSSKPVAAHLAYMLSFLGEQPVALDVADGTGLDALRFASAGDVFFVTTVSPYTRASVEAARHARDSGLVIVALTDSAASPVAVLAHHAIVVPTESPSFFHSMAPAFIAVEILAALVAGEEGERALEAIADAERHFAALRIHLYEHAARTRRQEDQ
ncbi:MurR/RpiR family transcriptional regulator, partial [Nitratireductor sp. GCM10026969]|uniref:MurR/RpiR family transcriptional regulator n=1 Tax=Nitratireductor sp. GCM10026969 TaxID=3252645 RepID=UPI00362071F8